MDYLIHLSEAYHLLKVYDMVYLEIKVVKDIEYQLTLIYLEFQYIIIYRIPIILIIYLTIYLISIIVRFIKKNITVVERIDSYRKKLIVINLIRNYNN